MKQTVAKFALGMVALFMLVAPTRMVGEDQPHMQAALKALQEAREHLQQAEHDKGGHRAKALQLTDQAIAHVKQGMQYDNKHEDKDRDHDRDHDKH